MQTIMNDNSQIEESIFLNKIQIEKGTTNKKELDKPYFDLNWLLKQKRLRNFYGRDFIFDKNINNKKR